MEWMKDNLVEYIHRKISDLCIFIGKEEPSKQTNRVMLVVIGEKKGEGIGDQVFLLDYNENVFLIKFQ